MTQNKDFKRLVRARMAKTGESYMAARAHLVVAEHLDRREPSPSEYADLADIKNATVKAKTGLTWREWVEALDAAGAREMDHTAIAKHVSAGWPKIGGWWAQSVTVGYERIRGLRLKGQDRDSGTFEANKSRTFPVGVERLYEAFEDEARRAAWLDADLELLTCRPNKSVRMRFADDTRVQAYFTAKGADKSSVAVQHAGLSRQADIAERKDFWASRFERLASVLAGDP